MTATTDMSNKNWLFIHGAWASGWGWNELLTHLPSDTNHYHVAYLPGSESWQASLDSNANFEDYIMYMSQLIESLKGSIWLIAHSGGGLTATALAEKYPNRITGIVYVAGMMLPSDTRFDQLCERVAKSGIQTKGIANYLEKTRYGTKVSLEGVESVFLQDASQQDAQQLYLKMVAQPDAARKVSVNWTQSRAGKVDKYYIIAKQDKSLVPEVQKAMIEATPTKGVVEIDSGHFPQLTKPKELALLLNELIG